MSLKTYEELIAENEKLKNHVKNKNIEITNLTYAENQKENLIKFLDDGRILLTNSKADIKFSRY